MDSAVANANIYHAYFVFYLKTFLSYLKKNYPLEEGVKKVLECFDDLEVKKVVKRFVQVMDPFGKKIRNKDETMFAEPIFFIPGIDLTRIWKMPTTTEENKDHIWTCLDMLLPIGRILENKEGESDKAMVDKLLKGKKQEKKMSVNSLMESHKNATEKIGDDKGELDVGSLMKIPGLEQYMDFDKLSAQLSQIPDEQIAEATQKMADMFGGPSADGNDSKIGNVMGDMIKEMFMEIKKTSASSPGNPANFLNMVKTVSDKMADKLEKNNIKNEEMIGFATKSLSKLGVSGDMIQNISAKVMSGNVGDLANLMNMEQLSKMALNAEKLGAEMGKKDDEEEDLEEPPKKAKKAKKVKKVKKAKK